MEHGSHLRRDVRVLRAAERWAAQARVDDTPRERMLDELEFFHRRLTALSHRLHGYQEFDDAHRPTLRRAARRRSRHARRTCSCRTFLRFWTQSELWTLQSVHSHSMRLVERGREQYARTLRLIEESRKLMGEV